VAGRVVMRERALVGVDRAAVAARVAAAAERALAEAPDPPPWRADMIDRLRQFYRGWPQPPSEPYCARNSRTAG